MIVQSFRSVMWVGAVAGAAIGCYMVSLRVASERARLETVETRILLAKRDIRALDTELSTRGRVRQLEQWNADVLALAPPGEGQFLQGEVQLASLPASTPPDEVTTPVRMASASAGAGEAEVGRTMTADFRPGDAPAKSLLIRASAPAKRAADAGAAIPKKSVKLAAASKDKVRIVGKVASKVKVAAKIRTQPKEKSAARNKPPSPSRKLAAGDKAPAGKKVKANKAL